MRKLSLLFGSNLIFIGCQFVESAEPEELGEVSQEFNLGSAVGTPVVAGVTCGLHNGITPACAPSNASDMSYTWTPRSSGTFTLSTNGSNFQNVLLLARSSTPFSPFRCNSSGSSSSIREVLRAGQQYIITVDGYAALCGYHELHITQNCADSSCTNPPPCSYPQGSCTSNGTCSYTSSCGGGEVCDGERCIPHCFIDPNYPC